MKTEAAASPTKEGKRRSKGQKIDPDKYAGYISSYASSVADVWSATAGSVGAAEAATPDDVLSSAAAASAVSSTDDIDPYFVQLCLEEVKSNEAKKEAKNKKREKDRQRSAAKYQQQKVNELKESKASDFCFKFLHEVYYHCVHRVGTGPRRHLDNVPENITLKGYLDQKGNITEALVGDNNTEVETIILSWMWHDGNRTRTAWEGDKEREAKNKKNKEEGSPAWSLKGVFECNRKYGKHNEDFMTEYNQEINITYANYLDRPYAFVNKFEVKRIDIIEDSVIPGFVKGSTYSYNEEETKDVPQRVFWNGELIDTTNLLYVKLEDVPGKYVLIEKKKAKTKRKLIVDSSTGRLRDKVVAFYRVGDFLTREEIHRAITKGEKCKHAIPGFIMISVKYRHHQLKLMEEKRKEQAAEEDNGNNEAKNDMPVEKKQIMVFAAEFIKTLREVLCENYTLFAITDFMRIAWVMWTSFDMRFDKCLEEEAMKKRKNTRARVKRRELKKNAGVDLNQVFADIKQLDYTTIISFTQHGADEKIYGVFRQISEGLDDLDSYLKPLEKLHFAEYFEVLVEIFRPVSGMFTTRALTVLYIFVVSAVLFDGKVPTDEIDILSFWQIAEKKSNLIRNCLDGVYNGVGVDSHVINFFTACAKHLFSNDDKKLSKDDAYYIGREMPENPGAYLNELVGECTQSYNARKDEADGRWDKWQIVLREVVKRKVELKQFIDIWLPEWERDALEE